MHHVFRLPKELFFTKKNSNTSMRGLRQAIQGFPWIVRGHEAVENLRMKGKLRCRACFAGSSRLGTGSCSLIWTQKHHESCHRGEKDKILKEAQAAAELAEEKDLPLTLDTIVNRALGPRQTALTEYGLRLNGKEDYEASARALLASMLVAGGDENGGIPPSNIGKVLCPPVVTLLKHFGGTSSAKTITNKEIPETIQLLKERIKKLLKGKPVSFGIDCGSSNLYHGIKVMAVEIMSPLLTYSIYAGGNLPLKHETGEGQADYAEKIRQEYGIRKEDIFYLGADNASVNKKAVEVLNDKYGWNIKLARCLPHCLNLVLEKFLDEWDKQYHLKGFLTTCRSFIKAGGAFSRKATIVEYGLQASNIDFVQTRWTSLVTGARYLMEKQSKRDLANANELLSMRADLGDEIAKEALRSIDEPRMRYDVLYEALEDIYQTLPEGRKGASDGIRNFIVYETDSRTVTAAAGNVSRPELTAQNLMGYLACVDSFVGLCALNMIMAAVPKINKVMQREVHTYTPEDTNLSEEVRQLIDYMGVFESEEDLSLLVKEVEKRSLEHKDAVMRKEFELGDALEDDVAAGGHLDTVFRTSLERALAKLKDTLKLCAANVRECAGLKKLKESTDADEMRQTFLGTCDMPTFLSLTAMCKHFNLVISVDKAISLRSEMQTYKNIPGKTPFLSLFDCASFWADETTVNKFPHMSKLAISYLSRPANNAGVERYFSILTHMDRPNRRSMKSQALLNNMFLRCNAELVRSLGEHYSKYVSNPVLDIARNIVSGQKAEEEKRKTIEEIYKECREAAALKTRAEMQANRRDASEDEESDDGKSEDEESGDVEFSADDDSDSDAQQSAAKRARYK